MQKALSLELDVSNLNRGKYNKESLTIIVSVVTISNNNNLNNTKRLEINLVTEADLMISG